jgi:cell division protein FtsL
MKKKGYIPPRSYNEQKNIHFKVLIGAIIVTVIVVVISIISQ